MKSKVLEAPASWAAAGRMCTAGVALAVLFLFSCRSAVAGELELRYYGAEWCAPCRKIEPMVERWAATHGDLRIVKLDYDAHEADRLRFGFIGVPVLVLMDGNTFVGKYGQDARKISDFAGHRLQWWYESAQGKIGAEPSEDR